MKNILDDTSIKSILPILKGHKVFIVGGFVRDYLLFDKFSNDKDLIVEDIPPKALADKIAKRLSASLVLLDSENEIYRVVLPDKINYFDITKPVEGDIIKDIKRRDFTINSIMFDIESEKIFDPFNFKSDLENKIIKTTDLNNLKDDPLRLLRAFRFQALYGFKIDDDIKNFIKENGNLIKNSASERINYEILKLFEGKFLVDTLYDMADTGFLKVLFPIFNEVEKIPSNTHHHLPLMGHLIETVNQIRIDSPLLKLSALLHDIGKPSTWTIEETGRHRFIGHEKIGAKLAYKILSDMKFSKKQIAYIVLMIENHLYPSQLMSSEDKTKKAMLRFIKKLDPYVQDVIELARADRLSARGVMVTDKMVEDNLKNLQTLLDFYYEIKPTLINLPKLIRGDEIMQILNIKQGPRLGDIIAKVQEAQALGEINTKEDAIEYIKNINFS